MNEPTLLIPTAIAASMFAGVLLALLPRLPGLVAPQLGRTEARWPAGRAVTLLALVLMMLVAGVGIDKWGVRQVLLSGLLTALLGLALLERCRTKPLAALACALCGSASGAVVVATILLGSKKFYADHTAASTNLTFVFLTGGMMVTPGLTDWLTRRVGIGRALPLLALLGLVPATLACFTPVSAYPTVQAEEHLSRLAGDRHLWLLAGGVVCYQAIAASLPGWSGAYENEMGLSRRRLGFGLLLNPGLWFMVGQVAAIHWVPPDWEPGMLALLAICLAILIGNTLGNDRPLSGILGLVVAFACIGPLLPTLLGLAVSRYAQGQATVLGALLAVNATAAALLAPTGTPGTGRVPDRVPVRLCLSGVLLLALIALALGLLR